jgi:hypothetical protein
MALLVFRRIQIEMVGISAHSWGPCEIGYANIKFLLMFVFVVSVPAIYNTHLLFHFLDLCFSQMGFIPCYIFPFFDI